MSLKERANELETRARRQKLIADCLEGDGYLDIADRMRRNSWMLKRKERAARQKMWARKRRKAL